MSYGVVPPSTSALNGAERLWREPRDDQQTSDRTSLLPAASGLHPASSALPEPSVAHGTGPPSNVQQFMSGARALLRNHLLHEQPGGGSAPFGSGSKYSPLMTNGDDAQRSSRFHPAPASPSSNLKDDALPRSTGGRLWQSLDYEVIDNVVSRATQASETPASDLKYIVAKWLLCFVLGVITALAAFTVNIAVENIAGFKFWATLSLLDRGWYFGSYTGEQAVEQMGTCSLFVIYLLSVYCDHGCCMKLKLWLPKIRLD